jgi:hypothetical protein
LTLPVQGAQRFRLHEMPEVTNDRKTDRLASPSYTYNLFRLANRRAAAVTAETIKAAR